MVSQGPYPSDTQLSERNAFTIRYFRQCWSARVCGDVVSIHDGQEGGGPPTSSWERLDECSVSNPRPSGPVWLQMQMRLIR